MNFFFSMAVSLPDFGGLTGVRPDMAEVDTPQELDLELVRRVQRGESAAFDVLVRKYQHRIVALIGRYIADWSECQDVAQDTFVRAYRAINSFSWRRPVLYVAAPHCRQHCQEPSGCA